MQKQRNRTFKLALVAFLLVMFLAFIPGFAGDAQAVEDEVSFEQMLHELRQEFFSPIRAARGPGLRQVHIDTRNTLRAQQVNFEPKYNGTIQFEAFSHKTM